MNLLVKPQRRKMGMKPIHVKTEEDAKNIIDIISDKMEEAKQLDEEIKLLKNSLQNYYDTQINAKKSIMTKNAMATFVESVYIKYKGWHLEKRLKKVGKHKIAEEIMKKEYRIVDWQLFTDLMKNTGIKPRTLKTHFHIDYNVDQRKVQDLFEKGVITKEDLEGNFTSNVVKSIRIKKRQ